MFFKMMIMGMLHIGIAYNSVAQQSKLDAALNTLENYKKEDTIKASLMYKAATLCMRINSKKALSISKELAILGYKLKCSEAIFGSMEIEGSYFMLSLKLDSAFYIFNSAKEYAETIKRNDFIGSAKGNMASIYLLKGKTDEAITILEETVINFHKYKDFETEGKFLVNLANAYNAKGDRVLALKTALKALDINTKYGSTNAVATANYVIGSIYGITGQFKEALQYHQGYTNCQIELSNWNNACSGLIAIANDYKQLNETDSASIYYSKALSLAKEYKLTAQENKININLSTRNDFKNNEEKEIAELKKLKTIYENNGAAQDLGMVLYKLAIAYTNASPTYLSKKGIDNEAKNKLAFDYLNDAMNIAVKSNNYALKEEVTRSISQFYEAKKDYVNAYDTYKKYITLRDSALDQSQQVEISKLNMQYAFKKKEDSLKLIQANTDGALARQGFLNKQQQQNILLQSKELLLNKQTLFANQQEFTILNKDKELQHLAFLKTQADLQTEQLQNSEQEKELTLVQKEALLKSTQLKNLSQENELNKLKQRQLLFYGIVGLASLLFAGLYLFNRNKAKQAQLKVELEKKEAEFQRSLADVSMSALRSQMNPHFIFNCLNSIKLYTTQNDNVAAANYLTKFSKLIRMALENSRSERVTLEAELESLELYIQMEAMRFKEKLKYNIAVDKNVDSSFIEIPPMLLQPYVENAIWHGLMHKEDGGRIDVGVAVMPDEHTLAITIKDNGVGREKAAQLRSKTATTHKSFGTKVTGERLDLINQIYNTGASVTTEDVIDNGIVTGTLVTIKIPFD
jgi:tetratricopeptide (TPR) repeat protein